MCKTCRSWDRPLIADGRCSHVGPEINDEFRAVPVLETDDLEVIAGLLDFRPPSVHLDRAIARVRSAGFEIVRFAIRREDEVAFILNLPRLAHVAHLRSAVLLATVVGLALELGTGNYRPAEQLGERFAAASDMGDLLLTRRIAASED